MTRKGPNKSRFRSRGAFTLVELLVVLTVIGLLAAMIFPAYNSAKENVRRTQCRSNLKQIDLALLLYASNNQDVLPPPQQPAGYWPLGLQPNYTALQVLECPDDSSAVLQTSNQPVAPDLAPRSYVINAFADYYASLSGSTIASLVFATKPWLLRMRHSVITHPSSTITFGEKASGFSVFAIDIFQPPTGSYLADLAENRHSNPSFFAQAGGANFAMADGSVQYLSYGDSTCPLNLWAVLDQWRLAAAICRPH
jgi:prepilin-type N-terminal cleavage/methylation domain-containing protein/prepilin-type processing-associated H-X9-DG protein